MAGLFTNTQGEQCRLLDAGAGIGSLSCAFLEQCATGKLCFGHVDVEAFEIDHALHAELERSLSGFTGRLPLDFEINAKDFIEEAVRRIIYGHGSNFTHAILNPPYKKIGNGSYHRRIMQDVKIEVVNLYAAFVALAIALMAEGGQLVAIIPRSFCNGPYYRPFRDYLRRKTALRRMHLFESRNTAFKDDGVLQENLILHLEVGGRQEAVVVSHSLDDQFTDLAVQAYPFARIVVPTDSERCIHVPQGDSGAEALSAVCTHTLSELGISVSTGPVVDFRLREYLRDLPEPGTIPLLYPGHFGAQALEWPKVGLRKPNAIQRNPATEKWLYPNGHYCVVRRFSSKEEKRRIFASVVRPDAFADATMLGFENHLNVFHDGKHGLPAALARGLAVYLNTSTVDRGFRSFNGHTQVNATDLKVIKYPSREMLMELGASVTEVPQDQHAIDALVKEISEHGKR